MRRLKGEEEGVRRGERGVCAGEEGGDWMWGWGGGVLTRGRRGRSGCGY